MNIEHESLFEVPKSRFDDEARELSERIMTFQDFLDYPYDAGDINILAARTNEIVNEVAELDAQCSYINTYVKVSGRVFCGHFDERTKANAIKLMEMTDYVMMSAGFAVFKVPDADGVLREQVGHMFYLAGNARTTIAHGILNRQTTTYQAFAPYGTIIVESERTPDENIAHLQQIAPDLVDEVDMTVGHADSPIAAMLQLRKMTVDARHTPDDVLDELATYAMDTVGLDTKELFEIQLHGTYKLRYQGETLRIAYDGHGPGGGSNTILAYYKDLTLGRYSSYVDNNAYSATDDYWHIGLRVVASKNQRKLDEIDVAIADIVDIQSVNQMIIDRWNTET